MGIKQVHPSCKKSKIIRNSDVEISNVIIGVSRHYESDEYTRGRLITLYNIYSIWTTDEFQKYNVYTLWGTLEIC